MKLYNSETEEVQEVPLDGYEFKFNLSKEKYCTGYYDNDGWHKCKLSKDGMPFKTKESGTQCFQCEKIQGFKSAFFFGQEPNEYMKTYLGQKHYIYLAYFEPGIIKVGTAADQRKMLRPLEQDALVYCYIAESDGFNIQKLERAISKEIGITESIKSSHKFKYLNKVPDFEKGQEMIFDTYRRIYARFKENDDYCDWLYEIEQVIIINVSNYVPYPLQNVTQIDTRAVMFNTSLPFVGKFFALRGKFILFENNSITYAFKQDFLIGRSIDYITNFSYQRQDDKMSLF